MTTASSRAGLVNTLIYVVVGASGATLLAIMGGYALTKFRFPGRKAVFAVIIGSISVPGIALAACSRSLPRGTTASCR